MAMVSRASRAARSRWPTKPASLRAWNRVTSAVATLSLPTAPPAPTATAATNVTDGSFLATWTAVADATDYRLDVSTSALFGTYVLDYHDLGTGPYLSAIVGAVPGTTYYYRVRAVTADGTSVSSNVISVTTTVPQGSSTTIVHDTVSAATLHAGLTTDANSYLVPTSPQAVWASFGTANTAYTMSSISFIAANKTAPYSCSRRTCWIAWTYST